MLAAPPCQPQVIRTSPQHSMPYRHRLQILCFAGHSMAPSSCCWLALALLPPLLLLLPPALTQSVALSLRMSDTDSVGISTFTRRMLPQGSVLTLLITCSACVQHGTTHRTSNTGWGWRQGESKTSTQLSTGTD